MRIIIHPLFVFDLFTRDLEVTDFALQKFLTVASGSVVMHMPIYNYENLDDASRIAYKQAAEKFEACAIKTFEYPTRDNKGWHMPAWVEEWLLETDDKEIIFCGGYAESCLAMAYGAFERDYGSFCAERGIQIKLDESLTVCASGTRYREDLFLTTRTGDSQKYSREEFDWRRRVTAMDNRNTPFNRS